MLNYLDSTDSPFVQGTKRVSVLTDASIASAGAASALAAISSRASRDFLATTEAVSGKTFRSVEHELFLQLLDALSWAKSFTDQKDMSILATAAEEAELLIMSGLFSERAYPKIRVDENGEFCFIISKEAAYVDIGVCGEGELSYHVRNDAEHHSTFGDVEIAPDSIPDDLKASLRSI